MGADYLIYATFSGEAGSSVAGDAPSNAGGETPAAPITPIQCVTALSKDGAVVGPVTGTYDELRGMALDAAGRLYVAVANKRQSAVDVFSATAGKGGMRAFVQTLLWPPLQNPVPSPVGLSPAIGLAHPYGLTFAPPANGSADTLVVSSQDTNVVCAYAVQAGSPMVATAVPVATALSPFGSTFYPGTIAASQSGIPVGTGTSSATAAASVVPPDVPAPLGLALNFDAQGRVTEPNTTSRHSVRGVLYAGGILYVADQYGDRVVRYDPDHGTFIDAITTTHDASAKPNAISMPVGLAYDPANAYVYVGCPGKPGAIFRYDVGSGHLHLVVSSDSNGPHTGALEKVSGLALTPDGKLLFASRKTRKLYRVHSSGTIDELTSTAFSDEPECLLVVPAA